MQYDLQELRSLNHRNQTFSRTKFKYFMATIVPRGAGAGGGPTAPISIFCHLIFVTTFLEHSRKSTYTLPTDSIYYVREVMN